VRGHAADRALAPDAEAGRVTTEALPARRPPLVATPAATEREAAEPRRRPAVELMVFAALGGLALFQWSRLVTEPPAGRLLLALVAASTAAALLALLARSRLRRPVSSIVAITIATGGLAGALLAIGIPGRLLLPANWQELREGLSFGFAGVEGTELPYRGGDEWLRLALLCVAPATTAVAAAVAFWPGPRIRGRRLVALVMLLAAYGIAVTLDSPPGELLWGVVVLALAAAWMWAPRIASRRGAGAVGAVAAAGALALPLASSLDPAKPWWDYESWSWFGSQREVTFQWDHGYGPLDWPQRGTTLFEVQSTEPLYWKASVLDRFDGFTWQRAREADIYAFNERAARQFIPGANLAERHPGWVNLVRFQVRALSSPFVIAAGALTDLEGVQSATASNDGTVTKAGSPVEAGDEYTVTAYVPDPTVDQLRAAPRSYPDRLRSQVLVGLPTAGGPPAAAADGELALGSLEPVESQAMGLWGREDEEARAAALGSAYAPVYRLSHRLVAGARTPYDGLIAIQRYLHRNYTYNPDVRRAPYPLGAFLFDQREGYCQHFAGSMALMLRMVGIPARVVAGFAPGTLDADRNIYTVHDTDAHSWVEAYFRGIGWVTFDPTPAAAPAVSQSLNELAAFRGVDPAAVEGGGRETRRQERETSAPRQVAAAEDDGLPWGPIALGGLGLIVAGGGAYLVAAWRRHRALVGGTATDAQLGELIEALRRLGWGLPPHATLLTVERRFESAGRPAVARYAARLRAHRFAPGGQPAPGPSARRALRRALAGGGGLGRRLRGLVAIPLGGPRARDGG
jgi:protein-glutamine gamma-glutamyltransferase